MRTTVYRARVASRIYTVCVLQMIIVFFYLFMRFFSKMATVCAMEEKSWEKSGKVDLLVLFFECNQIRTSLKTRNDL